MSAFADHYRSLAGSFSVTIAAVPRDRWDDPSPCEGWTAREVVQHVVDSEIGMLGRVGLAPDSATVARRPIRPVGGDPRSRPAVAR